VTLSIDSTATVLLVGGVAWGAALRRSHVTTVIK
jgi:hypothetical protein